MSRSRYNNDDCPVCGLKYRDLRTDMDFKEVRMMFWVASSDYSKWKYKRRHAVLGLWHQIKLSMWKEHLYMCEQQLMYLEAQQKLEEELTELVSIVREDSDIPF